MLLKLERHNPQEPWVQYEIQTKLEAPKTLFEKYYATYKIYISSHTSHYCYCYYYYYYYYYYMSFKLLSLSIVYYSSSKNCMPETISFFSNYGAEFCSSDVKLIRDAEMNWKGQW